MSLLRFVKHDTEDIINVVTKGYEDKRVKIYVKVLPYEALIFSVLPQLKCTHCGFYGRSHNCPPYIPPYWWWREKLKEYNVFFLIVGYANIEKEIEYEKKVWNNTDWMAEFKAGNRYNTILKWKVFDYINDKYRFLRSMGYKAIKFEAGGGCRLCKKCKVLEKKPCARPNEAVPSPEACGIELYKMMLMYDDMQIPPITEYRFIGMIGTKIPDYKPEKPKTKNIKIKYDLPFEPVKVYNAIDLYDPELMKCKCEHYSDMICKKLYKEPDMREWIKDKKLYAVKLKKPISSRRGIDELYEYVLNLHRQGVYWVFPLSHIRCQICELCSFDYHMYKGYKVLQNRRMPRCIKFFNLNPKRFDIEFYETVMSEYIGFILL